MKTFALIRRRRPTMVLAVGWVCLPWVLLADQKVLSPPSATTDTKAAGYDLEIEEGQLIRPGGRVGATLATVVDSLRDRYAEANIIIAPGLEKLKVADLKLRAGRLGEELEAVRVASGDKFEVQGPVAPNLLMDPNTGLPLGGGVKLNAGLFVLREPRPTPETRRIVEALNIRPYLDWLQSKGPGLLDQHRDEDNAMSNIVQIISDTLRSFKGENDTVEQPSFQFHRGATMLVVIGSIESVEIARKIVNALPGMSSVAEESRARYYGLESPRNPAAAAQEAFRRRYGLTRESGTPDQPGNPASESGPPK